MKIFTNFINLHFDYSSYILKNFINALFSSSSLTNCDYEITCRSSLECLLQSSSDNRTDSFLRNLSDTLLKSAEDILNNNGADKCNYEADIKKYKRVFNFEEAPGYLKHNVYIRSGYRGSLNTKYCLDRYSWRLGGDFY